MSRMMPNDEAKERSNDRESGAERMAERMQNHRPKEGRVQSSRSDGAGAMKGNMSKAVSSVERQTERGKHTPEVGGHKMHSHSGCLKD